jgi:hypothetical protein
MDNCILSIPSIDFFCIHICIFMSINIHERFLVFLYVVDTLEMCVYVAERQVHALFEMTIEMFIALI